MGPQRATFTGAEEQRIVYLYLVHKLNMKQIAERFCCNSERIRVVLRRAGIPAGTGRGER